jgi:hypothetical protein
VAAGGYTVKVEGLKQLDRALKQTDKEAAKGLRKELREAAKVVAMDARQKFMGVDGRSAMGIRPRVRSGLVAVAEQSRKRTTGKRPDYGALQMRSALMPALRENQDEVIRRVDDMLERLEKEF